ncbi:hypothetical protein L7F22_004851 [Adiantum nelumboides]|nr:hypothetical protein [Adiantum nelumboides]
MQTLEAPFFGEALQNGLVGVEPFDVATIGADGPVEVFGGGAARGAHEGDERGGRGVVSSALHGAADGGGAGVDVEDEAVDLVEAEEDVVLVGLALHARLAARELVNDGHHRLAFSCCLCRAHHHHRGHRHHHHSCDHHPRRRLRHGFSLELFAARLSLSL